MRAGLLAEEARQTERWRQRPPPRWGDKCLERFPSHPHTVSPNPCSLLQSLWPPQSSVAPGLRPLLSQEPNPSTLGWSQEWGCGQGADRAPRTQDGPLRDLAGGVSQGLRGTWPFLTMAGSSRLRGRCGTSAGGQGAVSQWQLREEQLVPFLPYPVLPGPRQQAGPSKPGTGDSSPNSAPLQAWTWHG